MKPEESLLCPQEPAIAAYPEPDQSIHNTAWMYVQPGCFEYVETVIRKHMKYAANRGI
jgi:hypothetical protein